MNNYKVTKISADRDSLATIIHKRCEACNIELIPDNMRYMIEGVSNRPSPYEGQPAEYRFATTCSEGCANIFVLQNMDVRAGRSGYSTQALVEMISNIGK